MVFCRKTEYRRGRDCPLPAGIRILGGSHVALFSSNNPKEKQHSGILGAFSVDVIKWEPESDQEASVIVHKYEYEDFPNGSYLIVGPSQMAVFTNNLNAGNSLEDDAPIPKVDIELLPAKSSWRPATAALRPFGTSPTL